MRARNWPFWSAERRRAAAQRVWGRPARLQHSRWRRAASTIRVTFLSFPLASCRARASRCDAANARSAGGCHRASLGVGAFGEQSSLHPLDLGLPQRASLTYSPRVVTTGEKRGVSTMSQSAFETSEQVLKFDPKAKGRSDVTPLDDAGQAIVAQIERPPISRTRTAIVPCRWPTNFRWSFERRKIERISYWRKWSFGATAQLAPKNGFEQFRKRSRTSSSFGDRYPASKKRYFTARSRVAKGCIVVL